MLLHEFVKGGLVRVRVRTYPFMGVATPPAHSTGAVADISPEGQCSGALAAARECVSYLGICRNQLHVDVIKQTVKAMIVTELVGQARSLILSVTIHIPVWDHAH